MARVPASCIMGTIIFLYSTSCCYDHFRRYSRISASLPGSVCSYRIQEQKKKNTPIGTNIYPGIYPEYTDHICCGNIWTGPIIQLTPSQTVPFNAGCHSGFYLNGNKAGSATLSIQPFNRSFENQSERLFFQ